MTDGIYAPLHDHLALQTTSTTLSFPEIEAFVGPLPPSARAYRAWWANDQTHSQAKAWLDAGFRVDAIDMTDEVVTFTPAQAPVLTLPAPERPAEAHPIVAGAGVSIDFEWTIVGLVTIDSGDRLVFPLVPTSPGMYRFRWTQSNDSHIYVGEASDLRRRFGNYRNPGPTQTTNTRMNERLRPLVRSGVSVEVATATSVVLHIDGEPTVADLAWRPRRLLAENAALIRACADGSAKVFNL